MRRRSTALAAVCTAALALSSCVDSRTDPPPPPVKVGAKDLYGTWRGWEGSSLTLRTGSRAVTVRLDGQEFAFDDAWRMTGSGTWRLLGPGAYRGGNTVGNGSVIHVEASPRTGRREEAKPTASASGPSGPVDPADVTSRTEPPPEKAVWDIGVSKGEKGELRLFFLTSDPDVRDTYYLTRDTTTASP